MSHNDHLKALAGIIGSATGRSTESVLAEVAHRGQKERQRVARNNARYDAAAARITPAQQARIDALVAAGARRDSRLQQSRRSGLVAVLLSKQAWWGARGRMGRKLMFVYPDGTVTETFERSIDLRADF